MKNIMGFEIYYMGTGEKIIDKIYAINNSGKLLLYSPRTGYIELPKEGKYVIRYGDGKLEMY